MSDCLGLPIPRSQEDSSVDKGSNDGSCSDGSVDTAIDDTDSDKDPYVEISSDMEAEEPHRDPTNSAMYLVLRVTCSKLRNFSQELQSACRNIAIFAAVAIASAGGVLCTSACSGCEMLPFMVNLALLCLSKFMACELLKIRHAWSCENVDWKAKWIALLCGPPAVIFKSVHDLCALP